ncbi:MAG: glycosyltransferase family 39 protein [Candidatus Lindowbacteria bacterium]|nr:glycosyltransferase family 39 protein [Candidatus Lindowbacteria bacterium]
MQAEDDLTQKQSRIILISLVVVAFLIRIWGIGDRETWMDEGFTYLILKDGPRHGVPQLYFWIITPFVKMFGMNLFAMRLPSTLFDIAYILLMYGLVSDVFDRKTGIAAATLATFSAYQVYYSQEARSYTLMIVSLLLLVYLMVKQIKTSGKWWGISAGVLAVMILQLHYVAVFFLCTSLFFWFVASLIRKDRPAITCSVFSLITVIASTFVIIFDPTTLRVYETGIEETRSVMYMFEPSSIYEGVKKTMYMIYVFLTGFIHPFFYSHGSISTSSGYALRTIPIVAAGILVGGACHRAKESDLVARWLILSAFLAIVSLFSSAYVLEYGFDFWRFQSRHLSYLVIPLQILIACGFLHFLKSKKAIAWAAAFVLIVYSIGGIAVFHSRNLKTSGESWSVIMKDIANAHPDAQIIVSQHVYFAILYYRDHTAMPHRIINYPRDWEAIYKGERLEADSEEKTKLLLDRIKPEFETVVIDFRHHLRHDEVLLGYLRELYSNESERSYNPGLGSSYAVPTTVYSFSRNLE